MRRGVELLYMSGCQHFLASVVRIFRCRMWRSRWLGVRMTMLDRFEISIGVSRICWRFTAESRWNDVKSDIYYHHVCYLCIFLTVLFRPSDPISILRPGRIGCEAVASSADARVKGRWTRVACGDHYRHNCTPSIGFLATIFGRQAGGKVLATREKAILRGKHVGTWGTTKRRDRKKPRRQDYVQVKREKCCALTKLC